LGGSYNSQELKGGTIKKQNIIDSFLLFMQWQERPFKDWCVGISQDARTRLSNGHGVIGGDVWTAEAANNSAEAREIETYFIKERGTDGGQGGGDPTATEVYLYLKNSHTQP